MRYVDCMAKRRQDVVHVYKLKVRDLYLLGV